MKIALLLQREPFGAILEQTLSRHLASSTGSAHEVRWIAGSTLTERLRSSPGTWLCNPTLNSIFYSRARAAVFETPWREYLKGRTVIHSAAHGAYLVAATAPLTRALLAPHRLTISPEPVWAPDVLIMGGNARLRLLDTRRGEVSVLLKHGYDCSLVTKELELRSKQAWLPAPALSWVAEDGLSYRETLLRGTAADRLIAPGRTDSALIWALEVCNRLAERTRADIGLREWIDAEVEGCHLAVRSVKSVAGDVPERALQCVTHVARRLRERGAALPATVPVATSHGDLQPGNVLVGRQGRWLIDWERTAQRIIGYDWLTLALDSRRRQQCLIRRARRLLDGRPEGAVARHVCSLIDHATAGSATFREALMHLFLVAETRFHLEECASGPLLGPPPGLRAIVSAVSELL